MPVTEVSVCNSALIKVGADRISSLTQDTKSAELLNAVFSTVRDDVLRSHPWNFAIKRATLSPTEDTPDSEYDYEYDLPSDCLRVLDTPEDDTIDWVIEGDRKLLTNEPEEIAIRYIYRNEDPSTWDSMFAEALAWRLAMEVSYNLTQSITLSQYCDAKYKEVLAFARSMDGAEGIMKNLVADDWTDFRR